jgi:hypothetical protein
MQPPPKEAFEYFFLSRHRLPQGVTDTLAFVPCFPFWAGIRVRIRIVRDTGRPRADSFLEDDHEGVTDGWHPGIKGRRIALVNKDEGPPLIDRGAEWIVGSQAWGKLTDLI